MSDTTPDFLAQATTAVWDVLADRGARSGKGYMRTSTNVVSGRRRILADALAPFVPEGTTSANAQAVATVLASRLATDKALATKVAAAMEAPPQPPPGNAPSVAIRS